MQFRFTPSYIRYVRGYDAQTKERISEAVSKVIDYYKTGQAAVGLGLTHLKDNFWEARVGLKIRLLWRKSGDVVEFVLAGNHDQVRRFLSPRVQQ